MKRLVVAIALLGCTPTRVPPDAAPQPDADAQALPDWSDMDPCGSAYARMAAMACTPYHPNTGSWVEACNNARRGGLTFGISCVRKATLKVQLPACGVTCQ